MQTLGTDVSLKPSDFDIHAAFYYQMGKNQADTKVSAWMASAKVGYKIDLVWGVSVGYDYRSGRSTSGRSQGENDGKGDKDKAFDQFFGTHHKFYGAMDYFLRTVPTGLQDIQAGVSAKASQKTSLQLNYHYFLAAQKAANDKKDLGHEIDLQLTTTLMKNVTLMAGYSVMKGTETMDLVKGGSHKSWQDWAWVTLNVNPRIFSSKW